MRERAGWRRGDLLELGLVAALFLLYLFGFPPGSPLFGPDEVFDQDSPYILDSLAASRRYEWNPQNHLLYHVLTERGHALWRLLFPNDADSAFRFLKLFTALTGLGFLLSLRLLFRRMGLGAPRRSALLGLAGLSVSAWFNFSSFETYCLAMPFLGLYLAALYRLARSDRPATADRVLLVASLVVCVLTRTDLWRVPLVTGGLLLLPACRGLRRALAVDLAAVAVIGAASTVTLAKSYFDASWPRAVRKAAARVDRSTLRDRLMRPENLHPLHLLQVGRAASVYALIMPVDGTPRVMDIPDERRVRYFLEPLANLLRRPLSAVALAAALLLLGATALRGLRLVARGDPFLAVVAAHWALGWVFFTWFNPFEPFLWIAPFHALLVAAVAAALRTDPPWAWAGVATVAVVVGLHNFVFFFQGFR